MRADPIKPWFEALESTGEFTSMRFGRVDLETNTVDWIFKPHNQYDGIGAVADILRKHGNDISSLPQITHAHPDSWIPFIKSIPTILGRRRTLDWSSKVMESYTEKSSPSEPTKAFAWHVFDQKMTRRLLEATKDSDFTVNSLLMKHLDTSIRRNLKDSSETIPWMIPVNMRGKVNQVHDTDNHSSFASIEIDPRDEPEDVQRKLLDKLNSGQHWASWKSYEASHGLSPSIKKYLVEKDKAISPWCLGCFSNLGVWDPNFEISDEYCSAPWLACPPVLRCQQLGVGCLTFQNQLGLCLQIHPELSASADLAELWVDDWVKEIEKDVQRIRDN